MLTTRTREHPLGSEFGIFDLDLGLRGTGNEESLVNSILLEIFRDESVMLTTKGGKLRRGWCQERVTIKGDLFDSSNTGACRP